MWSASLAMLVSVAVLVKNCRRFLAGKCRPPCNAREAGRAPDTETVAPTTPLPDDSWQYPDTVPGMTGVATRIISR
ncbi:MAG: hypothetical protein ACRD22_05215 [Terriglobia bacterium]